MLPCAGTYVSGADGSNECPAGSVRIETEVACRTAVAAAGKILPAYSFLGTWYDVPRGCYYYTSGNAAYFNTHAVGAGWSGTKLLCAAITAGAPPHCTHARARTHTHTHAHTRTHTHTHTHTYVSTNTHMYISVYEYR